LLPRIAGAAGAKFREKRLIAPHGASPFADVSPIDPANQKTAGNVQFRSNRSTFDWSTVLRSTARRPAHSLYA
jgi:hypothetical protein